MAYFNHSFQKLFIGTHASQSFSAGVSAAVDEGFLTTAGIPTVNLITTAPPFALGLGVYGLFSPKTYLSVNAASTEITSGAPLILASTALYCKDKISSFIGGYQESTKSKVINPKYVNRFYRVNPCTANPHVLHVGNTPFTEDSGVAAVTITTPGSGYTDGVYNNVSFTDTGTGALATVTVTGGFVTNIVFTTPGKGYSVGDILTSPTIPGGSGATFTVTLLTPVDPTCCKEFLCDETYFLRVDVKGSPELRYLSRNGYWTTATYTGCCPPDCGTPVPVDSTLVFIAFANELLANRIVGPFLNIVVYDETGIAWYAPGDAAGTFGDPGGLSLSPGVGSLTITKPGSGYVDGTYCNVQLLSCNIGSGALVTVTVAGGVVTNIVVTNPGMNYKIGDILNLPSLPTHAHSICESAEFSVTTLITPTWNNYISPGHQAGKCAGMKIVGAYVDTKFGNCTFYPNDHFEKEPVKVFASLVDETGDVCQFGQLCVVEECGPRQGMGFGEQVLRDLILSESYMQNYFYTGQDLRIREVTQGYDISDAIIRSAQYYRYFLLHSVPRFNNPTGVFDNDQYLLEIITAAPSATFESTVTTWLNACNCAAEFEIVTCGPCCQATCPVILLATPTPVGAVGVPYSSTVAASGGTAPYKYEVTAGILPPGLVLNPSTGAITGTPTTAGIYTFNVTAIDSEGCEGTGTFTITIS